MRWSATGSWGSRSHAMPVRRIAASRYVAHASGASFYFTARRGDARVHAADGRYVPIPRGACRGDRPGERRPRAATSLRRREPGRQVTVGDRAAGTLNYLAGPRSEWRRRLPTYGELTYRDVWPGHRRVVPRRGRSVQVRVPRRRRRGSAPSPHVRGADGRVGPPAGTADVTPLGTLTTRARPATSESVDGLSRVASLPARHGSRLRLRAWSGLRPHPAARDRPGLAYSTFLGERRDEGAGSRSTPKAMSMSPGCDSATSRRPSARTTRRPTAASTPS